jgi:hypothetical protein
MDIDLTKLTEAELIELNRRIIGRIKQLRQSRVNASMAVFNLGDRVSFTPTGEPEVTGTVVRLNRKSVTVVTAEGMQWRVAPSLLTKVAGAEQLEGLSVEKLQGSLLELVELQGRERGKA